MMSPSSSTSSSEAAGAAPAGPGATGQRLARRFVIALLLAAALGVGLCVGIIQAARHKGMETLPSSALLAHQLDKLRQPVPAVVFVGDSSLGNAIQASHWQALGGGSAANLALTGAYGYAGSYHMLRRVLRQGKPQTVVVMHTADIASRAPSALTELLIRPADELRWNERLALAWRMYINPTLLSSALEHLRKPKAGTEAIANDYVRQGPALAPGHRPTRLDPLALQPQALQWLGRLQALCREQQLNCVYAHGPLHRASCAGSGQFVGRLNAELDRQGWRRLADTPICFDDADLGDSADHVSPAAKPRYTELHLQRLQQAAR